MWKLEAANPPEAAAVTEVWAVAWVALHSGLEDALEWF
jgi:hypothetical protein